MSVHPKEDIVEGGFERTQIRRFYIHKIGERFNIGIDRYFELPYHRAMFMYELVMAEHNHTTPEERKRQAELAEMERNLRGEK